MKLKKSIAQSITLATLIGCSNVLALNPEISFNVISDNEYSVISYNEEAEPTILFSSMFGYPDYKLKERIIEFNGKRLFLKDSQLSDLNKVISEHYLIQSKLERCSWGKEREILNAQLELNRQSILIFMENILKNSCNYYT